jgi:uncharacterized protein (DUF2164 family)
MNTNNTILNLLIGSIAIVTLVFAGNNIYNQGIKDGRQEIQQSAVKHNFAHWECDEKGIVKFTWNITQ